MSAVLKTVTYARQGMVGVITLNRPEKLNAINAEMVGDLNSALDLAEADPKVRAIVLKGAGRAFSAGFDMGDSEAKSVREELTDDFKVIMRFWDSPKPTLAAVHGYCLGSAMEMAVACDITIAADNCRFGAPEVQFGSGIVALILPWLIGPKASKELLLSGDDQVSAERAQSLGLVNRVTSEENLIETAMAMAERIACNDLTAVRYTKQAINKSFDIMGMREALLAGLETDIEIESQDSAQSREFSEILAAEGPKAAIAWRLARLKEETND